MTCASVSTTSDLFQVALESGPEQIIKSVVRYSNRQRGLYTDIAVTTSLFLPFEELDRMFDLGVIKESQSS